MLPSTKDVGTIKLGHGVQQGIISALDAFMRTLNYEMRNSIDVIAVRGSVENGFRYLGKQSVSEWFMFKWIIAMFYNIMS